MRREMSWDERPQGLHEEFSILPILEISLTVACVRCGEDEREHSERDVGAQVPQWKSRVPVCQSTSMRQYASSPRKEERDYKGLQRARVALPVWPAHQPHRFPGETSVPGPIVAT